MVLRVRDLLLELLIELLYLLGLSVQLLYLLLLLVYFFLQSIHFKLGFAGFFLILFLPLLYRRLHRFQLILDHLGLLGQLLELGLFLVFFLPQFLDLLSEPTVRVLLHLLYFLQHLSLFLTLCF